MLTTNMIRKVLFFILFCLFVCPPFAVLCETKYFTKLYANFLILFLVLYFINKCVCKIAGPVQYEHV